LENIIMARHMQIRKRPPEIIHHEYSARRTIAARNPAEVPP
jgi:hypothetical protein